MGRFLWMSCCQTSLFILVGSPCFSQMSLIITVSGRVVKNPPANIGGARNVGSIPVSGRSPGVGNGNPFQHSCLENAMDRGARQATVHGSQKVRHEWTHTAQYKPRPALQIYSGLQTEILLASVCLHFTGSVFALQIFLVSNLAYRIIGFSSYIWLTLFHSVSKTESRTQTSTSFSSSIKLSW